MYRKRLFGNGYLKVSGLGNRRSPEICLLFYLRPRASELSKVDGFRGRGSKNKQELNTYRLRELKGRARATAMLPTHPGAPVLSEREFFARDIDRRYGRNGPRCC